MLSIPRSGFYVYTLSRPDGSVFYIGKGKGRRVLAHEREAKTDCQCHKCCVIRKIWRNKGKVKKAIIHRCTSESEAYTKEAEYITLYGLGSLANVLPGEPRHIQPYRFSNPKRNEVTYLAHLRRLGKSKAEIKELMEDWHDRKIEALKRQRRYAVLVGDTDLRNAVDLQIESHKIALGEFSQSSFYDTL